MADSGAKKAAVNSLQTHFEHYIAIEDGSKELKDEDDGKERH